MSFFSNVRETSDRYGRYVAEFKELFRKHEVSFGKAEDFFQLAPKLAYDGAFRTTFAGLTESVRNREDGKLTLARMLTIIAIGMGGPEVETLGTASAVPISLVVVFLAGVGGWSETEPEVVTTAPQQRASRDVRVPAPDRSVAGGNKEEQEREAEAPEQRLASRSSHDLSELTASLFAGPALVKDALSRLESNTLELKHHLDSIDQRIDRIEPHLDQIASRIESSTEVRPLASRSELPPDARPRSERNGQARGVRPNLQFTQHELVAPSLEELAAVEASFRAGEPVEAEAPVVVDRSAVEGMLRAAELEKAEPVESEALELEKTEPVEAETPVVVDRSAVEGMLRAAELEKAEPVKEDEPLMADRFEAEAMPQASEPAKQKVVAPVVEEREAVEPRIESPKLEPVPSVAPVVIANKYESIRVQRLHRMIAVLGVLLFILVGVAAALLYRDRDWVVQKLVKNRRVNAGSLAREAEAGLPPPDRGGGTSSNLPTQLMQTSSVATPQTESKSSGSLEQGELSGGRAKGPISTESNRKVQNQTVMEQSQARGVAKQPPVLESAPAKIPSTKQEAPPSVAAVGPGWMIAGLPGSVSGATTRGPVNVVGAAGGLDSAARGDISGTPSVRVDLSKPLPVTASAMKKNLIDSPKPTYPVGARFQRVEGDVLVRVLISEAGTILKATAVSGPQPLRGAAESAMRQWRYKPYMVDGMPVKVQTEMNFHFTLKPE